MLSYQFEVYADAALTSPVAASSSVAAGASGSTSWNGLSSLVDGDTYYWRAVATDTHGATRESAVSTFTLDSANAEPTMPAVATPAFGSKVASTDVTFVVNNAQDSDGDPLSYRFELDTVPTFDSPAKRVSGTVSEGAGTTAWNATGLTEDTTYYWRAKASDGPSESPWVQGRFSVNAVNSAPGPVSLLNPADGAWDNQLSAVLQLVKHADGDGDPLSYQYEVYADAAPTNLVASGASPDALLQVTPALPDYNWYWWRVRGNDGTQTGPWSAGQALYIHRRGITEVGDANGDGRVDSLDLGRMMSQWAHAGRMDLDANGVAGNKDLTQLLKQWSRP